MSSLVQILKIPDVEISGYETAKYAEKAPENHTKATLL